MASEADERLIGEALAGPLAPVAGAVRAAVLPSVRLLRSGSDREAPVGRIGGAPRLAPGAEWPRWRERPLGYLAEVELAAVPGVEPGLLPQAGTLSFFFDVGEDQPWGFDPADRGSGRVIFTPAGAERVELEPPPGAVSPGMAYAEGDLAARVELTLADSFAPAAPELPEGELRDAYDALFDALLDHHGDERVPQHRLLGHPDQVQGEMQTEAQLASNGIYLGGSKGYRGLRARWLRRGAPEWRLLLQLDSEFDGQEVMWGDAGRIYFWAREPDLRRGDFSGAWTILQCG